jgi:hypothetical protein
MPSWPVMVASVNDLALWLRESIPRQLSLVEPDDHLSGAGRTGDQTGDVVHRGDLRGIAVHGNI